MKLMTSEQLQGCFKKLDKHAGMFREMVQNALISCAYFAFKDGNTEPFNQLITAVGNGTHIAGITRWVELIAGIGRVNKGKIVLNKKVRDVAGVIDEATFAEYQDAMSQVKWYDAAGEQHAVSVFDEGTYMNGVVKKLSKNGFAGLADHLKQAELMYWVEQAEAQRQADEQAAADALLDEERRLVALEEENTVETR